MCVRERDFIYPDLSLVGICRLLLLWLSLLGSRVCNTTEYLQDEIVTSSGRSLGNEEVPSSNADTRRYISRVPSFDCEMCDRSFGSEEALGSEFKYAIEISSSRLEIECKVYLEKVGEV